LRYGHHGGSARGFSWKHGIIEYRCFEKHHLITSRPCDCRLSLLGPNNQPTGLNTDNQTPCSTTLLRPRLLLCHPWWCRNINLLAITYAFRPRLRYRLTLGRIILPRETLGLRRPGFSPGLSLLMPALALVRAGTGHLCPACISLTMLPYRSVNRARGFGAEL
jgi:hypothetical protein